MRTRLTGKRVLVMDDDDLVRRALVRLLTFAGAEVETACDGREGLTKALQGAPPDAILLDVHMPVMGGVEAARKLRWSLDICIVLMSANDERATATWMRCAYLAKSNEITHAATIVADAIDAWQARTTTQPAK